MRGERAPSHARGGVGTHEHSDMVELVWTVNALLAASILIGWLRR